MEWDAPSNSLQLVDLHGFLFPTCAIGCQPPRTCAPMRLSTRAASGTMPSAQQSLGWTTSEDVEEVSINHVESFPGGGRLRIGKRQSEQTCRWPTRVLPSFSQKFGANSTIILARALWKFEVAKTQSPKQVDWFLWLKLNTFSNTFLARSAAVDLSVAWDAQETKVCGIIM